VRAAGKRYALADARPRGLINCLAET